MHPPHPGDRPTRSPLPYGAVMATAGASHLARSVGPHRWANPLLVIAAAAAIAIPVRAAWRHHSDRQAFGGCWSPGDFTVPLGLAVVAVGLTSEGRPWHDGVAQVVVATAWLTSVIVLCRLAATMRPHLRDVDGSWFLAPAAALGDALGLCSLTATGPLSPAARWAAQLATVIGILSYLVVLALAAARITRHGLRGSAKAPWWISAGCGGLAAATAGRVAGAGPVHLPVDVVEDIVVALWIVACLAMIPVVMVSLEHLLRARRSHRRPPWPPTFSTAVFALGTLEAARWAESTALEQAGRVAGWTTVALWCGTVVLAVRRRLRRR